MDLSMATCNAEKANMKSSEYRKVIKPLLERRRRARINSCLDELKALILENAQNENTDASKLEKADILELTVQHLRTLRRSSPPTSPSPVQQQTVDKYRSGFAECAHEVSSYISSIGGVETHVKSRLITHLAHCINRIQTYGQQSAVTTTTVIDPAAQRLSSTPTTNIRHHPYANSTGTTMTLNTPTPPPSPVSPYQQCASPVTTVQQSSYAVPVSPVSPVASPLPYNNKYGAYSTPAMRGEVYVWTDMQSSPAARRPLLSPVDSQYSDDCSYQREAVSPASSYHSSGSSYHSQRDIEVDFRQQQPQQQQLHDSNGKPWRPW